MRIDSRDLHGLPVVTETGRRLGKILSFEIDVETHGILVYHVGQRNWVGGGAQYMITPQEILSITAEQMTVKDGTVKVVEENFQKVSSPLSPISSAVSRRE